MPTRWRGGRAAEGDTSKVTRCRESRTCALQKSPNGQVSVSLNLESSRPTRRLAAYPLAGRAYLAWAGSGWAELGRAGLGRTLAGPAKPWGSPHRPVPSRAAQPRATPRRTDANEISQLILHQRACFPPTFPISLVCFVINYLCSTLHGLFAPGCERTERCWLASSYWCTYCWDNA